jgi:signal transduction histidine kinase
MTTGLHAKPLLPAWRARWAGVPWMGWRLRATVMTTLIGVAVAGLFITGVSSVNVLAETPALDRQGVRITGANGQTHRVAKLEDSGGTVVGLEDALSGRSQRWTVDDAQRHRSVAAHDTLAKAVAQGAMVWTLSDGSRIPTVAQPIGSRNLGLLFWLTTALALVVYLGAVAALLVRPVPRNGLYAVIALPQAGNLLFIAAQSALNPFVPEGFAAWEWTGRSVFDVITATAFVHAMALHPRPGPWRHWLPAVAWLACLLFCVLILLGALPHAWWLTQTFMMACGLVAILQLSATRRLDPHPLAHALMRNGSALIAGFLLLTTVLVMASSMQPSPVAATVIDVAPVVWVVFFALMVLAAPYMAKPQVALREFSLVAGVSTLTTVLDLLFVAALSLSAFTSLALATFLGLMVYAGARQWVLNHVLKTNLITTERMFEQLYRIGRDTEQTPAERPDRLATLFTDLFDPIEVRWTPQQYTRSQVTGGGAVLVVPMPQTSQLAAEQSGRRPRSSLLLQYARRGQRLFTQEDANLTDRVIEQLELAVANTLAEERGRRDERERIAQDLHDDIGARLLTLMYRAKDPDVEDYIRYTIQDLKTLTRGLATQEHPLANAAGEWKASVTQRLLEADALCEWHFDADDNPDLTMVQWSALTRILRELVTNAIAHGRAQAVRVEIVLRQGRLRLRFSDNGVGTNPAAWQHGLGVGGIRKRVRALNGTVSWTQRQPVGIECVVDVELRPPEAFV